MEIRRPIQTSWRLSTLLRVLERLELEMTLVPKDNHQHARNASAASTLDPQLSNLQDDNTDDLEFWLGDED